MNEFENKGKGVFTLNSSQNTDITIISQVNPKKR